ncbi:MAG TPA: hypothetical protein VFT79_03255 [Solirubrobacterales bacterium]|nr:hypothetical protein [Solirubrobacterales bacterium]
MKARIFFPVSMAFLALLMPQVSVAETQLNYAPAKRAMQAKADRFAGKRTRITLMFRLKPTVYSGRAEWDRVDPTGCKGCGYDPVTGEFYDTPSNESCSVSMVAKKLASGRIRVRLEDSLCY